MSFKATRFLFLYAIEVCDSTGTLDSPFPTSLSSLRHEGSRMCTVSLLAVVLQSLSDHD